MLINFVVPLEPSRDVSSYTKIIHGPSPRTQAVFDMSTRLAAILRIIKKLLVTNICTDTSVLISMVIIKCPD